MAEKIFDRLRKPRPNLEIPTILRCIRKDSKALFAENDFTTRRGYAAVLIAHLESLMEQPEFLPPVLQDGSAKHDSAILFPKFSGLNAPPFVDISPFDDAAIDQEYYFYLSERLISGLYRGPAVSPHLLGGWTIAGTTTVPQHGLVVSVLRPVFLTSPGQSFHLDSLLTVRDLIHADLNTPQVGDARYAVIINPLAIVESSFCLGSFTERTRAERIARRLHKMLRIRFLVAEVVDSWDFH